MSWGGSELHPFLKVRNTVQSGGIRGQPRVVGSGSRGSRGWVQEGEGLWSQERATAKEGGQSSRNCWPGRMGIPTTREVHGEKSQRAVRVAGEAGGNTCHRKTDSASKRKRGQRSREFTASSHSRKSPQMKEGSALLCIVREKNGKVGFLVARMKETSSGDQRRTN